MSINQKSGWQTFRRKFVSGSLFVSPCPLECNFQSETKIEPDLRLGLTGLLMTLCMWSHLFPISKLLAIQDNALNLEEQLWMEGGEYYIAQKCDWAVFRWSVSTFLQLVVVVNDVLHHRIWNLVFVRPHSQRFQNSSLWIAFLKRCIFVTVFTKYMWTVIQTGQKKSPLSNRNGYVWTELEFTSCDL